MSPVDSVFANRALTASLLAWFIAQSIKFATQLVFEHRINLRVLVSSGGMPSAHTALVTCLAAAVGRLDGLTSTTFAVALIFAVVVMYDAAGVRRAVGVQASILNRMLEEYFTEQRISEKRLRELVGHTPVQVLAGAVLGLVIAWMTT